MSTKTSTIAQRRRRKWSATVTSMAAPGSVKKQQCHELRNVNCNSQNGVGEGEKGEVKQTK